MLGSLEIDTGLSQCPVNCGSLSPPRPWIRPPPCRYLRCHQVRAALVFDFPNTLTQLKEILTTAARVTGRFGERITGFSRRVSWGVALGLLASAPFPHRERGPSFGLTLPPTIPPSLPPFLSSSKAVVLNLDCMLESPRET